MTLKERVHKLVDATPDDSPSLEEVCETLALNQAVRDATEQIKSGEFKSIEQVKAEFETRWAKRRSK